MSYRETGWELLSARRNRLKLQHVYNTSIANKTDLNYLYRLISLFSLFHNNYIINVIRIPERLPLMYIDRNTIMLPINCCCYFLIHS